MRATRVAMAAALAVSGLVMVASVGRAETVGFADPRGDAYKSGHPAGDIEYVGADYTDNLVTIGVATVVAENPSRWGASEATGYSADIDVDGNGTTDYRAFYLGGGGRVYRGTSTSSPVCNIDERFDGEFYFAHFAAACIGAPASFRLRVFFNHEIVNSADHAPSANGWSPFVRRSGGSAAPPPPPQSSQPRGAFDGLLRQPGTATAVGWAVDDDSPTSPVEVHIYANGQPIASGRADRPRHDVGAAVPGAGPNHGFAISVPVGGPGPHRICVFAINIGGGPNPQLGCHTVTTSPFGSFDGLAQTRAGLALSGWAIDPDTADSIDVHVHLNGSPVLATTAAGDRPDVGRSFPGYGSAHGWSAAVAVGTGSHNLCAFAIDKVHPHQNTSLGCRRIVVNRDPMGSFDAIARDGSDLVVEGWAADWEAEVTTVHVYSNGTFVGSATADRPRPDVERSHPQFGPNVGFRAAFPGVPPAARVCVYALNAGPGSNKLLGCRTA